jgi:sialidase-1
VFYATLLRIPSKIPTLLRIPNTTKLLAIIEARKYSCDDAGWIDLLMRHSPDNGKTWNKPQKLIKDVALVSNEKEWHTVGDALPVYDRDTGKIHLVFTRDNEDAFVTHSEDLGQTWAPATNISDVAVKKRGGFCGTGHAAGLQMATGRLFVPMYGCGSNSFSLVSDDHGATWERKGGTDASPNEWVAAELVKGSGKLIGNIRNEKSRLISYSDDSGDSWSPTQHMETLPEPISGCEAAMILHPNGKLYYSHPDEHVLRNLFNVKVSSDGGKSWQQHVQLWGPEAGCKKPCVPAASYSSMQVLGEGKDSEIAVLYMRNNITMTIFEGRGVSFTTFKP